jgi:fatty acid desaturase
LASLNQEGTAGSASSPTSRWREYTQLSRQIKQAGLLDRRRAWYAAKISLNLALLAAGGAAFVALEDSWWQLVTAAYLAVVFTQLAFVGHDAGHRQIFRSRRGNDLAGLLHGNLGVGVSFGWWVPKHNLHHSNPNHEDLDPDIGIAVLAFTVGQARDKRGLVRFIARHQGFLFFPLLLLEAAHLHLASAKAIVRGRGRANAVEATLLLAHAAGYLTALLLVLSPLQSPESSRAGGSSESGGVQDGVVGRGLLPAGPDDPEPGTGDDAGGVWVALAAGAGVGVQAPGPGRGQA